MYFKKVSGTKKSIPVACVAVVVATAVVVVAAARLKTSSVLQTHDNSPSSTIRRSSRSPRIREIAFKLPRNVFFGQKHHLFKVSFGSKKRDGLDNSK
jgi:hypothetical protein